LVQNDPGLESRRGQEIFLLSKDSRVAVETHPASYSMSTGVISQEQGGRNVMLSAEDNSLSSPYYVPSWPGQCQLYLLHYEAFPRKAAGLGIFTVS